MTTADHKVIEQADVQQRQRLAQPPRQKLIRLGWFSDEARMVVRNEHPARAVPERARDDLARVDPRAVDGPGKEDLARNDPVPSVNRNYHEKLSLLTGQQRDQVLAHQMRCRKLRPRAA